MIKYFFANWVWQFPQMLLGLILVKILKAHKHTILMDNGERIINYWHFDRNSKFSKFISGVSLAVYILLSDNNNDDRTICHEYGHCLQSKKLGWLYLIVIGLPSIINNLWDRNFHKDWAYQDRIKWYYSRFPEKQADVLGEVVRNI